MFWLWVGLDPLGSSDTEQPPSVKSAAVKSLEPGPPVVHQGTAPSECVHACMCVCACGGGLVDDSAQPKYKERINLEAETGLHPPPASPAKTIHFLSFPTHFRL